MTAYDARVSGPFDMVSHVRVAIPVVVCKQMVWKTNVTNDYRMGPLMQTSEVSCVIDCHHQVRE